MLAQRACVYVYVLVCACVGKTMIAAALDQLGNGGLHSNEMCYSQPFHSQALAVMMCSGAITSQWAQVSCCTYSYSTDLHLCGC